MIVDALPETEWQAVETATPARILVIDDDKDQCRVLSYRLESHGFKVLVAHRGDLGLELARDESPDAILLDIRLPDADGLTMCEVLADDPRTAHIPVIIISGCERANIVREARQAGSRYYVRKPYDPNALLLLIVDSLDRELL